MELSSLDVLESSIALEWSGEVPLSVKGLEDVGTPSSPGLFRVGLEGEEGSVYVGETGRPLSVLLSELAEAVEGERMPFKDVEEAAPCLWALRDSSGRGLEVSWAAPEGAGDERLRLSLKSAVLALHRKRFGLSPEANFGRMAPGYTCSSYRKEGVRGYELSGNESIVSGGSAEPLEWSRFGEVKALQWMGLKWSSPRYFSELPGLDLPETGVYRLWRKGEDSCLSYVGEGEDLKGALMGHRSSYANGGLFSVAADPEWNSARKRLEIVTELVGVHFLALGDPPREQFTERARH